MRADLERASELACVLARVCAAPPPRVAEAVRLMRVAARFAKRAAEMRCNEPLTEAQDAALRRSEDRRATAARVALASLWPAGEAPRAHLRFGGDPRGACGTLVAEGVPGDGWAGDGWPIY